MKKDPHRYDDMLFLPHPVSGKHKPMSSESRAAQFMPFAALTGYEDFIAEAGRFTDRDMLMDEGVSQHLDRCLSLIIQQESDKKTEYSFELFQKDACKDGGSYRRVSGVIRKIDPVRREIVLFDKDGIHAGEILPLASIRKITGPGLPEL